MMEKVIGLPERGESGVGGLGEGAECNLAPTEMRSSAHSALVQGTGAWCGVKDVTETRICWCQRGPVVSFGSSHSSKAPLDSR